VMHPSSVLLSDSSLVCPRAEPSKINTGKNKIILFINSKKNQSPFLKRTSRTAGSKQWRVKLGLTD
jgi:hypothetical protein